jgi:hypothetical protein
MFDKYEGELDVSEHFSCRYGALFMIPEGTRGSTCTMRTTVKLRLRL